MTIYPDTTFLIGLYVAIDNHSEAALNVWRQFATAKASGLRAIVPRARS